MKPVHIYLFILACLGIGACCKGYCIDEGIVVSFQHFQKKDVDTTYFIGYEKGSNFTKQVDSIPVIYPGVSADTTQANQTKRLDTDRDWIIKIPALNKNYSFNNYQFVTARCSCDHNQFSQLDSFTFNGTTLNNSYVILE